MKSRKDTNTKKSGSTKGTSKFQNYVLEHITEMKSSRAKEKKNSRKGKQFDMSKQIFDDADVDLIADVLKDNLRTTEQLNIAVELQSKDRTFYEPTVTPTTSTANHKNGSGIVNIRRKSKR